MTLTIRTVSLDPLFSLGFSEFLSHRLHAYGRRRQGNCRMDEKNRIGCFNAVIPLLQHHRGKEQRKVSWVVGRLVCGRNSSNRVKLRELGQSSPEEHPVSVPLRCKKSRHLSIHLFLFLHLPTKSMNLCIHPFMNEWIHPLTHPFIC